MLKNAPYAPRALTPQVVLAKFLDHRIDITSAFVHALHQRAGVLQHALQWPTACCSIWVRSVVADDSGPIAPAIGSRPLANPVISCCNWSTLAVNCAPLASTVRARCSGC